MSHWHSSGLAPSHPLRAWMIASGSAKMVGEPQPPAGDSWVRTYFTDGADLFLFTTRLMEYFRSRAPGYPFTFLIPRARQLAYEPFLSHELIAYDPKLDMSRLVRFAPMPKFLGGQLSRVETDIGQAVEGLRQLDAFLELKSAWKDSQDETTKAELNDIIQRYDRKCQDIDKGTDSLFTRMQRERRLVDDLYQGASRHVRRVYEKWRTFEDVIQQVYSVLSTCVIGEQIWRWAWPSDRLEDLRIENHSSSIHVTVRTTNAPEMLFLQPGDIIALDFRKLGANLSGLFRVIGKTTSLGESPADVIEAERLCDSLNVVRSWSTFHDW